MVSDLGGVHGTVSRCLAFVPIPVRAPRLAQSPHKAAQFRHMSLTRFSAMTERRHSVGAIGEELAASHFCRRGFRIVERNFRTRWGELDLVACAPGLLVFCEVKTRIVTRGGRSPFESIHPHKRRQVRRIAGIWLAQRPDRPRVRDLRFDAIGVTLGHDGSLVRLEHLEGAF